MTNNKDSIKCPACAETIKAQAKKCRYCGEWLDSTNKLNEKQNLLAKPIKMETSFWVWVATLIIFYIFLFIAHGDFSNSPDLLSGMLLINILIGSVAFLVLIPGLLTGLFNKKTRRKSIVYGAVSAGLFALFFAGLYQFDDQRVTTKTFTNDPSPFPSLHISPEAADCPPDQVACYSGDSMKCVKPEICVSEIESATSKAKPGIKTNTTKVTSIKSNSSSITCIGPDGKQFETSMDECKNLNEKWGKPVDYMTNCSIHPDCGGGTKYISKSQCDKPCSGLPTTKNTSNTYPCKITSSGYIIQTKNQTECISMQADEINTSIKYSTCKLSSDLHRDQCLDPCNQNKDADNVACAAAYTGSNALISNNSELYGECLSETTSEWSSCTQPCWDKSSTEYAECIRK